MSEPNFHYFLTQIAAVNQLVSGRVYPDILKQGSIVPAIVHSKTGTQRQQKLCGTDGLVRGNFQLDVYATTRRRCRELSDLIIGSGRRGDTPPDGMLDYTGLMGTQCYVKSCALATDFDSVDPEPGLLKRVQLWDIWYVERD